MRIIIVKWNTYAIYLLDKEMSIAGSHKVGWFRENLFGHGTVHGESAYFFEHIFFWLTNIFFFIIMNYYTKKSLPITKGLLDCYTLSVLKYNLSKFIAKGPKIF